jgi:hypothetical protein
MFSATSAAAAIATRRARGDSRSSTECSRPIIGPAPQTRARFQADHAIPRRYGPATRIPRPPPFQRSAEDAAAGGSRHAADQRVIDLEDTYRRLAQPWSRDQLAACYHDADRRGAEGLGREHDQLTRPIALVATAIPRAATLSVAIHMLHALPPQARGTVGQELVDTAEKNAADALRRCHQALELDGRARGYAPDEFLPIVYDTAGALLESADPSEEPPTFVLQTQEAISWLSRAVVELDQDSAEASTTLTDTLASLLTVWVFADAAGDRRGR